MKIEHLRENKAGILHTGILRGELGMVVGQS